MTYLFDKLKVMLNGGMQLLHSRVRYLLKVDVALQASKCLDRYGQATRHCRATAKHVQLMLQLSKMSQCLSAVNRSLHVFVQHSFVFCC